METDLAQLGDRHERGEISVGRDENCPYEHKPTELVRLTRIKQLRVTGASKWAEIPYEINLTISSADVCFEHKSIKFYCEQIVWERLCMQSLIDVKQS